MSAVLVADEVTVLRGPTPVLSEVSLTVGPGSRTGVVGPNGVGKTTLLALRGRCSTRAVTTGTAASRARGAGTGSRCP